MPAASTVVVAVEEGEGNVAVVAVGMVLAPPPLEVTVKFNQFPIDIGVHLMRNVAANAALNSSLDYRTGSEVHSFR